MVESPKAEKTARKKVSSHWLISYFENFHVSPGYKTTCVTLPKQQHAFREILIAVVVLWKVIIAQPPRPQRPIKRCTKCSRPASSHIGPTGSSSSLSSLPFVTDIELPPDCQTIHYHLGT